MKCVLITGSSGLIGSEAVKYFDDCGWKVIGIDNNMRANFFGPSGDTLWNLNRLRNMTKNFHSLEIDIRDRLEIKIIINEVKPDFIIHAASQPSHDLAAKRPFDDFDVNAVGTLNLLEAARQARDARLCDPVFVFLSTNKVYGDGPNRIKLKELNSRWDYDDPKYIDGIAEDFPIDNCLHSLFGVSKASADLMTQEYGRYFSMKTGVFRGGCLTGPNHAGVELHGFLNYLFKVAREGGKYYIFGYKGKQVRDNIHSVDVISALEAFYNAPRMGEVYNIGGGRRNSCSIHEAIAAAETLFKKKMKVTYKDENRIGDHICYITNMNKFQLHYPEWSITKSLNDIYEDLAASDKRIT
jgi:CDP-paratose 2-epimerase